MIKPIMKNKQVFLWLVVAFIAVATAIANVWQSSSDAEKDRGRAKPAPC